MAGVRTLAVATAFAVGAGVLCPPAVGVTSPDAPVVRLDPAVPELRPAEITNVLVISVDALPSKVFKVLGPRKAPHLHAFRRSGASTLNARSQVEQTLTLPNHTGMVTGRRITADQGGHGVIWNDDRLHPRTVRAAAGRRVASVFSVIQTARGNSALFASKTKFSLWRRSWPRSVHRTIIMGDNAALTARLERDLRVHRRTFRFLHLSLPDSVSHQKGFMSPAYLKAVRITDKLVGRVVAAVDNSATLKHSTAIILTSDHGGVPGERQHKDATRPANHKVPFMVRGPGITPRTDLYRINPSYRDPGSSIPGYDALRQPIRNGAVANLALDLLGLGPVPGSLHNRRQDLTVFTGQSERPPHGGQAQSCPSSRSSASPMVPS